MKYLFILGRNVELSIAEIKSFLEKDGISFKILSKVHNGLLIDVGGSLPKGAVEKLGGTISIGKVLATGTLNEIFKELDRHPIYEVKGNKLNYVVFDFHGKGFVDVLQYLKNRFKEEGLKATEKKLTGKIKLQSGEIVSNLASNLIQEQYFIFENNFGRIIETSNYKEIEKRDMEKPVRRESLSISPRLAKILINLSQVKENETLLDPFCGIGVVLQEALLQKIKVVGIDIDKEAIEGAKTNLKWFNFSEKDYKILNGDSSKIKISEVEAIATEPDLGELQKSFPSPDKANKIIAGFEKLIIAVLKNLKKNVKKRIVFTSPLVQTRQKKLTCDFKKIASETGLKIVQGFPIDEFREDSIVGRSIVVLEK